MKESGNKSNVFTTLLPISEAWILLPKHLVVQVITGGCLCRRVTADTTYKKKYTTLHAFNTQYCLIFPKGHQHSFQEKKTILHSCANSKTNDI